MSDRNYLLLTPGPLTTSKTVKEAMLFDSCTWDEDYNLGVVQSIRQQLVALATPSAGYTSVLLQGSGSFAVEGVLGTVIGPQDKLLIVNNGAYGARMIEMARLMDIDHHAFDCGEVNEPDVAAMEAVLKNDTRISHIAMVHCETTTGMLNPLQKVAGLAARNGKTFIVDAMSSFGGIPLDVDALGIDFLISSANKCIQGCRGSLSSSPAAASWRNVPAVRARCRWICMPSGAVWKTRPANGALRRRPTPCWPLRRR